MMAPNNLSNKTLVLCPHCSSKVRKDRLEKHIRNVHHKASRAKSKKQIPGSLQKPERTNRKKISIKKITDWKPITSNIKPSKEIFIDESGFIVPMVDTQQENRKPTQNIYISPRKKTGKNKKIPKKKSVETEHTVNLPQENKKEPEKPKSPQKRKRTKTNEIPKDQSIEPSHIFEKIRDAVSDDEKTKQKKGHAEIPKYQPVICPICNRSMIYQELYDHIQANHPKENPKIILAKFKQVIRQRMGSSDYVDISNKPVNLEEAFSQSDDETRYAGKYLGYMRRESGKFGSLPLYDDYDDESNSE